MIRKIVSFEFELDDFFKEDLWQYTEDEEIVIYYEEAGYDSNLVMFTMGLELYYFVGTLLLTVLLSIVYNLLRCSSYCRFSKDRVGKFMEEYLYNGLIVFFL